MPDSDRPLLRGSPAPVEVFSPADDALACDAARIYARHSAELYRYARRFGDDAMADDVVQEVFLRVLLYKRADADRLTLPFLLAMTRNAALNALSRLPRGGSELPDGDAEPVATEHEPGDSALETSLAALLDDLSQRQRDTLELVEARGLSESQAARALSMTRSAVSSRRRKAVVRLRRIAAAAAGAAWTMPAGGAARARAA